MGYMEAAMLSPLSDVMDWARRKLTTKCDQALVYGFTARS